MKKRFVIITGIRFLECKNKYSFKQKSAERHTVAKLKDAKPPHSLYSCSFLSPRVGTKMKGGNSTEKDNTAGVVVSLARDSERLGSVE